MGQQRLAKQQKGTLSTLRVVARAYLIWTEQRVRSEIRQRYNRGRNKCKRILILKAKGYKFFICTTKGPTTKPNKVLWIMRIEMTKPKIIIGNWCRLTDVMNVCGFA